MYLQTCKYKVNRDTIACYVARPPIRRNQKLNSDNNVPDAPLFESDHNNYSVSDILGFVVDKSCTASKNFRCMFLAFSF